ncbi:MAG TPA: hypothetical protein VGQ76_22405 [Thermoanaerobaculia bacterium]|jgi:hypothetical protein|nr:hypothetical protein [Thermoanaerobaculia bacterium]
MAQPRKVIQVPAAEAAFILEALMREGRIDSRTVEEFRTRYRAEVASLEARLAYLRELSGTVVPAAVGAAAAPVVRKVKGAAPRVARATTKAVRKIASRVSPGRTRTRELQGRYLGLMHKIPKAIMKQRFGKEAIASKGKEAVLQEMAAYLAERR